MNAVLDIRPELEAELHLIAEQTHRSESEILNDALASYIEADRHYREVVAGRVEQAKRGRFASDEDVEAFFTKYAGPQ